MSHHRIPIVGTFHSPMMTRLLAHPSLHTDLSNKFEPHIQSSIVGSVVECSPATRAARVRFPDDAICFFKYKLTSGKKCVKKIWRRRYRSRYLSHAKRALYHLSYAPSLIGEYPKWEGVANFVLTFQFKVKVQANLKDSGCDHHECHPTFDSSVGRAVDCSCSASEIHRSLVQIRLEGNFGRCFGQSPTVTPAENKMFTPIPR